MRRNSGAVTLAIILLAWMSIARLEIVSPLFLPQPLDVLRAFRLQLLIGVSATASRAVVGFGLGILAAYLTHYLCVLFGLEKSMDAQFAGARAVPVIAVMPLFVIWFGFSEAGRLLIVGMTATAFFVAPFHEAYRLLGREWTILREQLSMSTSRYYWQIVVPGTLGTLLGPLRVTLAVAFTISIASEYIGARAGIGKFLDSARVTFNIPALFLAIIVSSTLGLVFDGCIRMIFARLVHWAGKDAKG